MESPRLGGYTIDAEIGSGGMGRVVRATGPDGVVALKVVHPHLLETPGFFKRFMREAQLGQAIRHDNVVRTLDCDQDLSGGSPQCFLVMEYVEGQTLSVLLAELERVPEELCRHVAREICKGLAAIHDAGVVHRDLKPDNVLITPDHVVKVMDLGVARLADEAMRLSKSGAFVGSVEYAAPEQFKGGDVDGRTDLHALGVLLYELASGVHPYGGGSFHEVLGRVCDEEPRRLGAVNPQVSPFFEEIVHTLLVKDPRGRFATATQLLGVLTDGEDSTWWRERARSLRAETKRPLRRVRIRRETAVYGRDQELERLRTQYESACAGEGQVVLIEGEAGIGKSRLVDELIAKLVADGEDLSFLFGSYPPGGAATADGAFSTAFREQLGDAGSAAYLHATPVLVPAFDALLNGSSVPAGVEPLTNQSLQTCFVNVARGLAAERTTVILIDDLHFAPEEGRALLSSLAMAVPGHRILLVATMRPGVPGEWVAGLTRLEHTTQLSLSRLGPKELIRLLQDAFQSEHLADSLGSQIALKSDGNPFFVFEIIRGLREGQFIQQLADGTWTSTRVIDEVSIPSSVLDLVTARVSGLTEDERSVLDVAACWGFEFDPLLVGEALGMARLPLLRMLGQIERRHRLVRSAGARFVFDHHQVQEALYGSISELLRREYHAMLGRALEARVADSGGPDGATCVALCEHLLAGGLGTRAVRYLDDAIDHLRSGYLSGQMVTLLDRALEVPGLLAGAKRGARLIDLTRALGSLGRTERAVAAAEEAVRCGRSSGDGPLLSHALIQLAEALRRTARMSEMEALALEALGTARSAADVYMEAVALIASGHVLMDLRRHDEALVKLEETVALAAENGLTLQEAAAVGSIGNIRKREGKTAEARVCYERAIEIARGLGRLDTVAAMTGNLGKIEEIEGRPDAARDWYREELRLSREIGYRDSELLALEKLAHLDHRQGRCDEARRGFEACLALCRETGNIETEAYSCSGLGLVAMGQGHFDEAAALQGRVLDISRARGDPHLEMIALINTGCVQLGQLRVFESQETTQEALELARAGRDRASEVICIGNIAFAASLAGDLERARVLTEQWIAIAREGTDEANGLQLLGELAVETEELERSEALFSQSLAIGERLRNADLIARNNMLLGAVRLARGDPDGARRRLEIARDLGREHGLPSPECGALAVLALIPGADARDAAVDAYRRNGSRMVIYERRIAPYLLWRSTGDRAFLVAAKAILDETLSHVPESWRRPMLENLRINRAIVAAWRADSADGGDREPPSTESATRVG